MLGEIIREKIASYTKYTNYVLYPLMGVFILFAGLYGYMSYANRKAEKLYNSGLMLLSDALEKEDGPDHEKLNKAITILEKINKYPMSRYHKLSMPFLGYIYFLKGDYNKALVFYKGFKKKIPNSSGEYASLTNLAISSCYEEKRKLGEAIKILERFSNEHPESPFREFALLSLERLYRLSNNPGKAKKAIGEFLKEYPNSLFFYMAKARLLSYNNIKK